MKLYKNVDIVDMESILEKGILSLNESNNNNWNEGKRAKNDTNVVYLFKPHNVGASLTNYGVALLEVSTDAKLNEINKDDANYGRYEEYITDYVGPEQITNIYIPELFKNRIHLPTEVLNKITWCKMEAKHYTEDGLVDADEVTLKQFAETADIETSTVFNFFRGRNLDRTIIDLYNVKYVISKQQGSQYKI